jgi:glutathione synthase/RimK-type ligase-like ATP-grasp enzyme
VIVLVNPVSSGTALADAFDEQGGECLHLYDPDLAPGTPDGRVFVHRDDDETLRVLERRRVTAVVAASEFGVTLADRLARELGLPHNSSVAAGARRDKFLMADAIAAAGLPAAWSASAGSRAELARLLDGATFPVMVKPRSSAGSDGCRICPTPDAALAAFDDIFSGRNLMGEVNSEILVQEYLSGPQFIVNTVTMEGKHALADYYHCRVDDTEAGAPVYRHIRAPLRLDDRDREIIEYALSCVDALGIVEGAAHTELRYTARGPRLVEVNARVMGPCLSPDPYFAALGVTHQHLVVERHLDPDRFATRIGAPYQPSRALAKVFLRAHREGILTGMPGLATLRALPGFHSIARLPVIGAPVPDRLLTTGASGIAFLVHDSETVLGESLSVLHDVEDAGHFYRVED